ncbi:MAG: hypothetical protein U9R10_05200 [Euryarchaeota archaeon]|nr:hypothetical protein [Euryarchaeota archaeon]
MDKAVSNTGPLIHLAEIGEFELLKIVSKIYIPKKVYEEVCTEGMAGEREVRNAENIEVLGVSREEIEKVRNKVDLKLDAGELQALALCNRVEVELFLTDDLDARDVGKQLGFGAEIIVLYLEAVLNQSVESQGVIAMAGYSTAKTMVYTKAEFVAFTDDECILGEA